MEVHDVQQGTAPWQALRRQYFTASEAPAMMGASRFQTRADLIRQKATGLSPEVDGHQQARFDAGHAAEAAYRPIAENIIGEELYPVTGTAHVAGLQLLASFDGLTMDESTGFEHKLWNESLAAHMTEHEEPGPAYYWQLEHQLLVSGAERILFVTSDGSMDREARCFYASKPERRAALIAGWRQFAQDLTEWKPESAPAEKVVAEPVEALPAPTVKVSGELALTDNFKVFEERLREFLANRLIREPKTDEDFVNLDAQIKAMKAGREALKSAKAQMLAQVQPIDQASKTADMLDTLLQQNCAMAESLLKNEKERRKGEIVARGVAALQAHVAGLNTRLGRPYMPKELAIADFAGAIKGMRVLASMEDAVGTLLANSKIKANEVADRLDVNLKWLREHAAAHALLFADAAQLVLKDNEAFAAIAQQRIDAHEAAEKAKADRLAEEARERIRKEEEAKLRREQEERDRAEAQRKREEEAAEARAQEERMERRTQIANELATQHIGMPDSAAEVVAAVAPAAPAPAPAPAPNVVAMPTRAPAVPTTPPTLKLGQIGERLGLGITAERLKALGFEPAARDRASLLFHESDFPLICAALVAHIQAVQAKQAA